MQRISIERYPEPTVAGTKCAGLVEGVRDDGTTWIMFLDDKGSPAVFFGHRDDAGGVEGEGIDLAGAG